MNTCETPIFFRIGGTKFFTTAEKLFQGLKMFTRELSKEELEQINSEVYDGRELQPFLRGDSYDAETISELNKSSMDIASVRHNAFFNAVGADGKPIDNTPAKSFLRDGVFPTYPSSCPLAGTQLSLKELIFYELIKAKLQVPAFAKALLDSNDSILMEHMKDLFWADGLGADGARNALGNLLMMVRQELIEQKVNGYYEVPTSFSETVCRYLGIQYDEPDIIKCNFADLENLAVAFVKDTEHEDVNDNFVLLAFPEISDSQKEILTKYNMSLTAESIVDGAGHVLWSLPLGTHFPLSEVVLLSQLVVGKDHEEVEDDNQEAYGEGQQHLGDSNPKDEYASGALRVLKDGVSNLAVAGAILPPAASDLE